jgi:hypothetical protein
MWKAGAVACQGCCMMKRSEGKSGGRRVHSVMGGGGRATPPCHVELRSDVSCLPARGPSLGHRNTRFPALPVGKPDTSYARPGLTPRFPNPVLAYRQFLRTISRAHPRRCNSKCSGTRSICMTSRGRHRNRTSSCSNADDGARSNASCNSCLCSCRYRPSRILPHHHRPA